MKLLLKGASVVNVFTDSLEQANVLLEDGRIIGVGAEYDEKDADETEYLEGKVIAPGLIDGHIHIESTMLHPAEFARLSLAHGTTTVIADPHEIANVAGMKGVRYMLEATENAPQTIYFAAPSCVPATDFDENGEALTPADIRELMKEPRIIGLGEMMNYPGVAAAAPPVMEKIRAAREAGKPVNGHAPLLSGRDLDRYIAAGIRDDHECSSAEEAKERIRKGQWLMIRQGTAAQNLKDLLPLFEEPWSRRCLLVTDDLHAVDLLDNGHLDRIIRTAVRYGCSVLTAVRMASLQAAQCFGLKETGAVAPGYKADLLVLDELKGFKVRDVYCGGVKTVSEGRTLPFAAAAVKPENEERVRNSFRMDPLTEDDLMISPGKGLCRVIALVKDQLITEEIHEKLDFSSGNGVDTERDILKLAVIERHHRTGHIGLGYVRGIGLKKGAVASSIAHDNHNLIVVGTNERDMAAAANHVLSIGGGVVSVCDGEILADVPLPLGGLMGDLPAAEMAEKNRMLRASAFRLGVPADQETYMGLSFLSLVVIPHLKLTPQGLFDADRFVPVPLFTEE